MTKPCPHRVRELLTYNHFTNVFHWKRKPFGMRGYNNPKNIAGSVDPTTKERLIRLDSIPFNVNDLIKYFPVPIQNKAIKTIPGVSWVNDKRSYRIRTFKNNKTVHIGYNKNFQEAVFTKLAGEQCLGIKSNKKLFAYCKNLVGSIK